MKIPIGGKHTVIFTSLSGAYTFVKGYRHRMGFVRVTTIPRNVLLKIAHIGIGILFGIKQTSKAFY